MMSIKSSSALLLLFATFADGKKPFKAKPSLRVKRDLVIADVPPPTCDDGYQLFDMSLILDYYPGETTWELTDHCTGEVLESGGPYWKKDLDHVIKVYYCVAPGQGLEFTIFDSYKDGICCDYGPGSYTLTFDGNVIVADGGWFGESDTTLIKECPGPTSPPTTDPPTTSPPIPPTPLTAAPTAADTGAPTVAATGSPSASITGSPTASVTDSPTIAATTSPTASVTGNPTISATYTPTSTLQTGVPTPVGTIFETGVGTEVPTGFCPVGYEVVETCVKLPPPAPSTVTRDPPPVAPTSPTTPTTPTTSSPTIVSTTVSTGSPTTVGTALESLTLTPTASTTIADSTVVPTSVATDVSPPTGSPAGVATGSPTSAEIATVTSVPTMYVATVSPSSSETFIETSTLSPTASTTTVVTGVPTTAEAGPPTVVTTPTTREPPSTPAPSGYCTDDEAHLELTITLDDWPTETYWSLYAYEQDQYRYTYYGNRRYWKKDKGMTHTYIYCVPRTRLYFYIYDSYGDGICCKHGQGSYTLTIDGVEVKTGGEFGWREWFYYTFGDVNEEGVPPLPQVQMSEIDDTTNYAK